MDQQGRIEIEVGREKPTIAGKNLEEEEVREGNVKK